MLYNKFIGILCVILLIVISVGLSWIPLYFLWNWLMPVIFGLPKISLLQSLGLCFLAKILFSGTSSSGSKS